MNQSHAHLPKDLLVDSEGEVQHVFNVVVLHPLQALVELLIQELQVTQVTWAARGEGRGYREVTEGSTSEVEGPLKSNGNSPPS